MLKKSFFVTILIFAFSLIFKLIPMNLAVLFPEQLAFSEFRISDILFHLRGHLPINSHIVLINCGITGRREIAELIDSVSRYQPKVIGIDMFFNCPDGINDTTTCPQILDTIGSKNLSIAIQRAKNIVLVNALRQSKKMVPETGYEADSLEFSDPMYSNYAVNGFASLMSTNSDDVHEVREFEPSVTIKDKTYHAFSVEVAKVFDPQATEHLLERNNQVEAINYHGNIHYPSKGIRGSFMTFEKEDVISDDFDRRLFKNKIILLGYLGDEISTYHFLEDAFFSPLNPRPLGRSYPDMYGLVIHANIIDQILSRDYINVMSVAFEWIIAFIVTFSFVLFLIWLKKKKRKWFFLLSTIAIVGAITLISTLRVFLFIRFNLQTNFSVMFISLVISSLALNSYDNLFNTVDNRAEEL